MAIAEPEVVSNGAVLLPVCTEARQEVALRRYHSWLAQRAEETDATQSKVAGVLEAMDVSVVISSQKAKNGKISVMDGGQLVLASTGMSDDPWVKIKPAWLEIEGTELAVLDLGGERSLQ